MEKKIEDYLHLYVGCDCQWNRPLDNSKVISKITLADIFWLIKKDDCKPILRPLSDMTEEEENQFCQHMAWIPPKAHYYLSSYTNDLVGSIEGARATLWLLKQGFDLFGLIEAGLAISKVDVSNPLKNVE